MYNKVTKCQVNNGDKMYYLNCFLIYSFLGFWFEFGVSKIMNHKFNSGILFGPITPIYGIGVVIILLMAKHIFDNLHLPKLIEVIIFFFSIIIVLTILEWLGGILIEKIFDKVFWNYSSFKFNIGKYVALEISLLWGAMSLMFIYIIKPIMDKYILRIPSNITIILLLCFFVDIMATFIIKKV